MISLTSPDRTWAHSVPAGVKLFALSVAGFLLLALDRPETLGVALILALALALSCGLAFSRSLVRSLRVLIPFLVIIALWHLITGTVLEGLTILLRLFTAFILANFVTMTTPLSEMMRVMTWLLSPLRALGLRTRALEIMVPLVIRMIPGLMGKAEKLTEAWRARSPKRPGWRVILPIAALGLDDADHVAEALRARGGLVEPES